MSELNDFFKQNLTKDNLKQLNDKIVDWNNKTIELYDLIKMWLSEPIKNNLIELKEEVIDNSYLDVDYKTYNLKIKFNRKTLKFISDFQWGYRYALTFDDKSFNFSYVNDHWNIQKSYDKSIELNEQTFTDFIKEVFE